MDLHDVFEMSTVHKIPWPLLDSQSSSFHMIRLTDDSKLKHNSTFHQISRCDSDHLRVILLK